MVKVNDSRFSNIINGIIGLFILETLVAILNLFVPFIIQMMAKFRKKKLSAKHTFHLFFTVVTAHFTFALFLLIFSPETI